MLKLMNTVFILVILSGGLQLSHSEKLNCEFKDVGYHFVGYLYTCEVTTLDNSFDNMTIDGYTGVHTGSKNVKDVKGIYIHGTNSKYIPEGLGSFSNIIALIIDSSELVVIRSKDFLEMHNLEFLSLATNKLTFVQSDTFSMLPKLKITYLDSNQIKYIGSGAFDQLRNLNKVDLRRNICVNELYEGTKYYNRATAITKMKKDLKVNCVEPLSTTTTTTKTTTTTQNSMEALNNKAKEQQQKNEIELNKLRDDLKKEQLENTKINKEKDALMINNDLLKLDKDALKMIIDTLLKEKDVWIKENDELKLKLKNKTSEINEICDTNCKPIEAENVKLNEINERLLKAFQNHQIEYLEIVKLKAELSTAKDQQKREKETVELKEPKMIDFDKLNTTDNMTLLNKCNSFTINCNFLNTNGAYTCETRNLFINQAEMELSEVIGTHLKSKSNQNVTELIIVKSYMFYWSKDIFTKFPALQTLRIQNAQLNEFKRGDFSSAFKLTVLEVNGNNIELLGDDVFHGTEEHLTKINLNSNQIEKISLISN